MRNAHHRVMKGTDYGVQVKECGVHAMPHTNKGIVPHFLSRGMSYRFILRSEEESINHTNMGTDREYDKLGAMGYSPCPI